MNIINYQPSFGAIKLSNTRKSFALGLAKNLSYKGFYDTGAGEIQHELSSLAEKAKIAQEIREHELLNADEFATLALNKNDEIYIIGNTIAFENKMLPIVQEFDPGARLNLGI